MLIQNYGLFWQLDKVHWGRQKNSGTLMGSAAKKKRAPDVNFREQRGVYVLYDDNFRIVYIGQAGAGNNDRLFHRLRSHKRDHLAQRWSRFSWFGLYPVDGGDIDQSYAISFGDEKGILDHIEAILIAAAEPPLNLQRGRFGSIVEQYLQSATIVDEDDDE